MEYQILLIITIILALAVIGMVVYLLTQGVFYSVKPKIEESGGYAITNQRFLGDPKEILPTLEKQVEILKKHQIGYAHPICIYDDIPASTAKEINAQIGFVLYKGTKENLIDLSKELSLATFEKKERIVVSFPFRGKLSLQLGIMKAYPAMIKFANKQNFTVGQVTEIYNGIERRVEYLMDFERN